MATLDHLDFDPVIGWAFGVRTDPGPPVTKELFARPLVWKWDVDENQPLVSGIPDNVDIVTVVQVPERTQQVRAFYDDDSDKVIGYQVLGASHPQDWVALAESVAPE